MIAMSDKYEKEFFKFIREKQNEKPEAFTTNYRKAVNALGSEEYISGKLRQAVDIIKEDTSEYARNLIFTNWIEFGTEQLSKMFRQYNISYRIISGSLSAVNRNECVQEFNSGKINTLVITKAGTEGIDLKGVQKIIVLDPVWNNATLDQIKGRGIRNNSHEHLPAQFRKVIIYLLMYAEQSYIDRKTKTSYSGDILLYNYIHRKLEIEKRVKEMLSRISIF